MGATCEKVTFTDQPLCGDKGALGASCAHTLVNKRDTKGNIIVKKLEPLDWAKTRFGWVCMPGDAYGEMKKNYEQLCKDHPDQCEYDKRPNSFFDAIQAVTK